MLLEILHLYFLFNFVSIECYRKRITVFLGGKVQWHLETEWLCWSTLRSKIAVKENAYLNHNGFVEYVVTIKLEHVSINFCLDLVHSFWFLDICKMGFWCLYSYWIHLFWDQKVDKLNELRYIGPPHWICSPYKNGPFIWLLLLTLVIYVTWIFITHIDLAYFEIYLEYVGHSFPQ